MPIRNLLNGSVTLFFCNINNNLNILELAKNRQLEISNGNDSTTPVEITSSNGNSVHIFCKYNFNCKSY